MSAALKIASGILEGRLDRRRLDEEKERRRKAEARQQQLDNLALLSRTADDERFELGEQPAGSSALRVADLTLGNQQVPLTFDPARSQKAKKEAADRAAHARLQASEPEVWGDFDPGFDYADAEREHRKRRDVEEGLVKTGMPRDRAQMLARHNLDLDKRNRDADAAKDAAESRADASESRRAAREREQRERVEKEAAGLALAEAMAADSKTPAATTVTAIAEKLKASYPKLSFAQRAGIAARAVQDVAEHRQKAKPKGRSTISVPGVGDVEIPEFESDADTSALPNETRQQLIHRLLREGKTDDEIATEIRRRKL